MSGVGGLFILGREAAVWFGSLAIPSKLTVVTIVFATASVGVGLVAPDSLPISPFTSSHVVPLPAPATSKPAAPVNPSIVASAKPSAAGRATTSSVAPTSTPASTTPTMPGADESRESESSPSTSTKTATTKKATSTTTPSPLPSSVYYKNCEAAWKAGAAPIRAGQPGYRSELDPDHNGVACEKRP